MREFKKGDRVRRTEAMPGYVDPGTIGSVVDFRDNGSSVVITWDSFVGRVNTYGGSSLACIELHSPATTAAPASAPAHHQLGAMAMSAAQAQRQQQQAQAQPEVTVCRKHAVDDGRCAGCDRDKFHAEAFRLRSELADVKGDRDRLLKANMHMEDRIAWLERENVRLSGKVRGCR